jgi:hypothetical protein
MCDAIILNFLQALNVVLLNAHLCKIIVKLGTIYIPLDLSYIILFGHTGCYPEDLKGTGGF